MDSPKVQLTKTELDFLHRLLLDVQRRLGDDDCAQPQDEQAVAGIELALALLQWDGTAPPDLDAQVGLGAAVQMRLGLDAMVAYRQWRTERRRQPAVTP